MLNSVLTPGWFIVAQAAAVVNHHVTRILALRPLLRHLVGTEEYYFLSYHIDLKALASKSDEKSDDIVYCVHDAATSATK